MNIYVASSWRNRYQPTVVKRLADEGYDVYDFRHPSPGDTGFSWSDIDEEWKRWRPETFVQALEHPLAHDGFGKDMGALSRADVVILLLPAGRSAHLEAGWAVAADASTCVYIPEPCEPELMYRMCDHMVTTMDELLKWLEEQAIVYAEEEVGGTP